ncbi:hypothetical protein [Streptomyces sp. NPDC050988]|uniref:hypothetical protein n=1 Tax=Streptomyces sp. NPDC050988 TaxID=3365637 RepID=UPI0037904A12
MFAADLIGRGFAACRHGIVLFGDMTELVMLEGKLCLTTCIDLGMREVIGWAMSDRRRSAARGRHANGPLDARSGARLRDAHGSRQRVQE